MRFLWISVLVVSLAGCATLEPSDTPPPASIQKPGVYHTVQHGQTLWSISQGYDISIDEVIQINQIPDAARLEEGQLLFIPGANETKSLAAKSSDPNKNEFVWPVPGQVVRYFNQAGQGISHKGIGIQVPPGEGVAASRAGTVVFADYLQGYAYTVILDHLDGFHSVYSMNSKVLVHVGDHVAKGDRLALAGAHGMGGLVYFEIRKSGQASNPLYYLPR
ncbi:MAG TPA: peptidoglycan DD-metalloendopeptidase family protein [Candidatus Omnitrophota bacterium]|nr:peptidoglycan DD-metalloendopeptidase family protein [Candidatus Omnitrophota bacterium]HQP11226.1 peptidoglycan DD-metalloendopeptidase family protein [Candidatus Omnitrophota bacterium]